MANQKYDVFISKNSKDRNFTNNLHSYLVHAGLSVFDSSQLPKLGDTDYASEIDKALELSNNLIVICSKNELATGKDPYSRWVYYEWTTFRNEILSKRKDGNIITILIDDVQVKDIAIGLRKYESLLGTNYEEKILGYFGKSVDPRPVTPSQEFNNKVKKGTKSYLFLSIIAVLIVSGLIIGNSLLHQKTISTQAPSTEFQPDTIDKVEEVSNTDVVIIEPEVTPAVDSPDFQMNQAIQRDDWETVRKLADEGYEPAYLPLAQHYLERSKTHNLADRYAQKAKKCGQVKDANKIINQLKEYHYYD